MKYSFIVAATGFALSLAAELQPWKSGPGGTEQECKKLSLQKARECFDSHEARPDTEPKLPWQDGEWKANPRQFKLCNDTHPNPNFKFRPILEQFCGTEIYCNLFDQDKTRVDGLFKSTEHCRQSHEAAP
ncbi:uncharacterized protein G6M90_00g081700 [Metarhizium brunneum]|uniref:Uncharacterized protein n=1 Tax=Metarhizium brunneum TaxID=500148 RepID=A0A7D5V1X9_9HYPO